VDTKLFFITFIRAKMGKSGSNRFVLLAFIGAGSSVLGVALATPFFAAITAVQGRRV
jgi:hypothetical protein